MLKISTAVDRVVERACGMVTFTGNGINYAVLHHVTAAENDSNAGLGILGAVQVPTLQEGRGDYSSATEICHNITWKRSS